MLNDVSVAECNLHPGEWVVERIVEDGQIEVARFSGPNAERRANWYAGALLSD